MNDTHEIVIDLRACWQRAKEKAESEVQLMYSPEMEYERSLHALFLTGRYYHQMIDKP